MRWRPLVATSPSGKTLFSCRYCGRVSPLPDKQCPDFPFRPEYMGGPADACHVLEERELKKAADILDSWSISTLEEMVSRVKEIRVQRGKSHDRLRNYLQAQRDTVIQAMKHLAFTHLERDKLLQWEVWEALDTFREVMRNER